MTDQVNIGQDNPIDFFDAHFDLGKIIRDTVSASATLEFIPPEYYEVEQDLRQQMIHMHGLDETESQVKKTVDHAGEIVRNAAGLVQERKCTLVHDLDVQKSAENRLDEEQKDKERQPVSITQSHYTLFNQHKPHTTTENVSPESKIK
jgi:hypothetical protein